MNSSSPRSVFPYCLVKCDRRTDQKQLPLRLPSVLFTLLPQFFISVVFPDGSPPPARIPPPPAGAGGPISRGPYPPVPDYPDDALCSFYDASLNAASRALSSEDGPREDFAAFVEWTLASNGWPLIICAVDDLARSTPDPEPSPPSPAVRSISPEPTDDGEPFPPRSASQRKAERLSRGLPRKLSPTRQIRCESRRQCPPRRSQPWTV